MTVRMTPRQRAHKETLQRLDDLESLLRECRDKSLNDGPYMMARDEMNAALGAIWRAQGIYRQYFIGIVPKEGK